LAAGSTPSFGDRKSYQMDSANGREALHEMELDAQEGADILMVKPALTSLDLLARARDRFDLPLAAYQVSGEAARSKAGGTCAVVKGSGAGLPGKAKPPALSTVMPLIWPALAPSVSISTMRRGS